MGLFTRTQKDENGKVEQRLWSDRLEKKVTSTVRDILERALSDTETVLARLKESFNLEGRIVEMREQIETLRIEKGRKDEEFARKEREIEHKVGLVKQRQKVELEQAKREATLSVREENLKASEDRFAKQMEFQQKRFEEEVGYLKDLMKDVMKRLPSAEIIANLGGKE
jgi:hypothetical protein